MAKINDTTDYPVTAPAAADNIIGTDVSNTTNDAAGETVNFNALEVSKLAIPAGGATGEMLAKASATDHDLAWTSRGPFTATRTITAATNDTWNIPSGCKNFTLQSADITGTTACSFNIHLQRQSDSANATIDTALTTISSAAATTFDQFPAAAFGFQVDPTAATWKIGIKHVTCEVPRSTSDKTRIRGDIAVRSATQFIRLYSSVCTSAEDHDKLYFSVSAGTMTGTIHITYWT